MGNASGLKAWQVIANSERALAIELLAASQAVEFLAPLDPVSARVRLTHTCARSRHACAMTVRSAPISRRSPTRSARTQNGSASAGVTAPRWKPRSFRMSAVSATRAADRAFARSSRFSTSGGQDLHPQRNRPARDRARVGRRRALERTPPVLPRSPGANHHPRAQRRAEMIATIHIGHVLRETAATPYRNLITRPTGAAVRDRIEAALARSDCAIALLDFSDVDLLDYSCADEVVAKLLMACRENNGPRRGAPGPAARTSSRRSTRCSATTVSPSWPSRPRMARPCPGSSARCPRTRARRSEASAIAAPSARVELAFTLGWSEARSREALLALLGRRVVALGRRDLPAPHHRMKGRRLGLSTTAIHGAARRKADWSPIAPALMQSSTFVSPVDSDEEVIYSRYGNNPNQVSLARKYALLEGAEEAVFVASGMGATALAHLAVLRPGDHLVSSSWIYGGTQTLFDEQLGRFGIEITYVHPDKPRGWRKSVRKATRAIFIETPTNPARPRHRSRRRWRRSPRNSGSRSSSTPPLPARSTSARSSTAPTSPSPAPPSTSTGTATSSPARWRARRRSSTK